jgi:TusE/DsrC/DsvC family sulfur relay protein
MEEILMSVSAASFPHAPHDWDISTAKAVASEDGLTMTDDHVELIKCLQEYYDKVEFPKLREITDALDEHFHTKGGMKYLYTIIPGGPVAQGCRLAGLDIPAGAVDKSFGSVA